jgi:cell division protein FtsA
MHKGNVAHVDEVAQALTEAVSEAERTSGTPIHEATININGAHVQGVSSKGVIAITNPNHEINEQDRMRVEEAATIVQLPPNKDIIQVFAKNYRIDSQDNIKNPVGMHGVRLEVDTHIVLASTPALKSMDQVFEKVGLGISHRTISSLAAAEAVLDRKQKESGTVVIDIGAGTTNIVVIEEGEIEHIAVIPIGGIHFTNDLAIGLKTDLDMAEQVKLKFASLEQETEQAAVLNKGGHEYFFDQSLIRMVVTARMEELLELADKELKRIHKSHRLPGGAVFVGGGSKIPGLVDFAKEQLQLPARVGSMRHVEKIVDGLDDQRLAGPVGLMMLDMLLGPTAHGNQTSEPGLLNNILISTTGLFKKLKKSK